MYKRQGTTTSPDFRYGSHIPGITKAGSYDVTYTVDAHGNIEKVMVGGVEAKRDTSMPGYYYSGLLYTSHARFNAYSCK